MRERESITALFNYLIVLMPCSRHSLANLESAQPPRCCQRPLDTNVEILEPRISVDVKHTVDIYALVLVPRTELRSWLRYPTGFF
jgi:hypothetical protein